jgi:ubiquinone/menaquinone biosynthesis C-methylase UbiE
LSGSITNETERVRRIWEKLAPNYDKGITIFEKLLFSGGRQWACSQATGVVLEIGVGTGRNLEYYPEGIELTGIDLSPQMIAVALDRARTLGCRANLRVGDAQALQVADESVDTVVCTLALCSISDDRRAIREVKRVLKPGGRFILMEHVASPIRLVKVFQQVLDWITVRIAADHQVREPLRHLEAEGFRLEALERLKWGIVERAVARRP